MIKSTQNVKIGQDVIKIESEALSSLAEKIGEDFHKAVELILKGQGLYEKTLKTIKDRIASKDE